MDPRHPDHAPIAAEVRAQVNAGTRLVTTDLVVAETHILLLRRIHRLAALEFLRQVRRPPNVVEFGSTERETSAVRDWLERFHDLDLSLADAVSFTVMRRRGIPEALTLDRHFRAAGFQTVP